MALVPGTNPDANRVPALDVTYGKNFRLNQHDIRTQAIVHPKVFGTQDTDRTGNFFPLSSHGQTLDQGVRVKNFGGKVAYIRVEDIGCTFDGPFPKRESFQISPTEEVFVECSNLSQVHYRNESVGTSDFGLTFIAS